MVFPLLTFLQVALIILVQNECSKREILLSNLVDPGVGIVHYVDTLELEEEYLCEVDVVERVCFVNLVLQ